MGYTAIESELVDGILILRHARADKLNARNAQMYVEIMAALEEASLNVDVHLVMLTAKGRYFSAGMDFNNEPRLAYDVLPTDSPAVAAIKQGFPQRDPEDVRTWPAVKFIESFINFDKPLIGAVNGPAIGEGFSSLLHCDVVYAADSAYFWAPFARAGVAPEFCSTTLMHQRLGSTLANAAIYLARQVSVEEAKQAGFVLDVFPAGEQFEARVVADIQAGLALMGPPGLRNKTLRSYKQLVTGARSRAKLIEVCHQEFQLVRERALSGETEKVQAYYRGQLPEQ